MNNKVNPKVFISYSHDDQEHEHWVEGLAGRLRRNGVDVIFDKYTQLGSDLALFMEQGLSAAHRVVCVCSQIYNEKVNAGRSGAGYEKRIICQELMQDSSTPWLIPVIRNNPTETKLPKFLSSFKYISFEKDSEYKEKYYELLEEIYNQKNIPSIGENPFSQTPTIRTKIEEMNKITAGLSFSSQDMSTVTFNYCSNSGVYTFGYGDFEFITVWSSASSSSIHAYNDHGLVLALSEIDVPVDNLRIDDYDFSSRVRTANISQTIIWVNHKGRILLTKIQNIKYESNTKHFLTVEYKILKSIDPVAYPIAD